jgi:hypothetical protein
MTTKIRTYKQDRTRDYLRDHPQERWRCDIYPDDGSDYHGVGRTEAEALRNAFAHWFQFAHKIDTRPTNDQ